MEQILIFDLKISVQNESSAIMLSIANTSWIDVSLRSHTLSIIQKSETSLNLKI